MKIIGISKESSPGLDIINMDWKIIIRVIREQMDFINSQSATPRNQFLLIDPDIWSLFMKCFEEFIDEEGVLYKPKEAQKNVYGNQFSTFMGNMFVPAKPSLKNWEQYHYSERAEEVYHPMVQVIGGDPR